MVAKYYIYRNLHLKDGGFSVKHRQKVIDRPQALICKDVNFNVSEIGRQRVLKKKHKNVHAYVVAEQYEKISDKILVMRNEFEEITYNPYKNKTFIWKETEEPVSSVSKAYLFRGKVYGIK